jgi:hypothetical protein
MSRPAQFSKTNWPFELILLSLAAVPVLSGALRK